MPPTCCRGQGMCLGKGRMQVVSLGSCRAWGWGNHSQWIEHSRGVSLLVHSQKVWLSLLSVYQTNQHGRGKVVGTGLLRTPLC